MKTELELEDFLTFEDTGEVQGDNWGESWPVVSVKFLGVEMERVAMPQWGWEKSYIDKDPYTEKASRVLKKLWEMEE